MSEKQLEVDVVGESASPAPAHNVRSTVINHAVDAMKRVFVATVSAVALVGALFMVAAPYIAAGLIMTGTCLVLYGTYSLIRA